MDRRTFLATLAALPVLSSQEPRRVPDYRIVTRFQPAERPGIPGPYPGRVVTVHSPTCIDVPTGTVDVPTVRTMLDRGMTSLTGDADPRDSWARLFGPEDAVGIKVNCVGGPVVASDPELVAEIAKNLIAVGVRPASIVVHDRHPGVFPQIRYERYIPDGVRTETASAGRGFDPDVYMEVNFFGEEDTRSFLAKMVTQEFTKIVNVPVMKDHGASGVTGCLKNIAYGLFNNVDRSHFRAQTETLTCIGTLASIEPLRSRTVLHVMDGLRGVWHAGPFSRDPRYRFYPKQLKFGTDPVAVDRFLLDVIDAKRREEGAISVWERDLKYYSPRLEDWQADPNVNRFIREPGHIEYASALGLGVYDTARIEHVELTV